MTAVVAKNKVVSMEKAGDKITVDANHPLAGQAPQFEVTMQDIRDATPDGRPAGHLPILQ